MTGWRASGFSSAPKPMAKPKNQKSTQARPPKVVGAPHGEVGAQMDGYMDMDE